MKLRVGLIGPGNTSETRHAAALRALGDRFEVRAVCGQVAHLAEQAAREFGAAVVDGYRALVAREDVDAVLVLSSQWYGALPILAACEAGKAVYCVPAVDMDPEHVESIKNRVEKSGVAFMVEFPRRHAPATLRLKELIATRLGRPELLLCRQRLPVEENNACTHLENPHVGPLRNLVELVDWCRYVVGLDVAAVTSIAYRDEVESPRPRYETMNVEFAGIGRPGQQTMAEISVGRYLPVMWSEARTFRPPAALQVACENGVAFVDLPSNVVWFDAAGRHQESLDGDRPAGEVLLGQFHRAVTSLVRKCSDLEDAYRSLLTVLAARKSQSEGRRICLDY